MSKVLSDYGNGNKLIFWYSCRTGQTIYSAGENSRRLLIIYIYNENKDASTYKRSVI